MSKVTYAQINIGRNVGSEPMNDDTWALFRYQAGVVLAKGTGAPIVSPILSGVEYHNGIGNWDANNEQSCHVSLYWEGGLDVDTVRTHAKYLAAMFHQDAVAIIVGSELIAA